MIKHNKKKHQDKKLQNVTNYVFSEIMLMMKLMFEIMRWGWLPLVGSLYILDQSMFKFKCFSLLGQLGQFVAPEA